MLMGCSCSYFAVAVNVTETEDVYPDRVLQPLLFAVQMHFYSFSELISEPQRLLASCAALIKTKPDRVVECIINTQLSWKNTLKEETFALVDRLAHSSAPKFAVGEDGSHMPFLSQLPEIGF